MGSLWCQEAYCAGDDKPILLESGEALGEIEIARTVAVMRTAIVYAAERQSQPVLVKVAHAGLEERLKREAVLLTKMQQRTKGSVPAHPALPLLLPAHAQAKLSSYPYGKIVVSGVAFYYAVLRFTPGEPLKDVLLHNPQPWYQHAGWLILAIADAIALMHSAGRLHICLSPEGILVRFDRDGIPRPLLLDLGAASPVDEMARNWRRSFTPPAYLAPELLSQVGAKLGAFTDVYGLGMILYEMLAGSPVYPPGQRPDTEIYRDVLEAQPTPLERSDLRKFPDLAAQAISKDHRRRPQQVINFARELQANLPPLPREKQERRVNWRMVAIGLSAAMAITLLVALALSLGSLPG